MHQIRRYVRRIATLGVVVTLVGAAALQTASDASKKPPIILGYQNTQTGYLAFPQFTDGVNAAEKYVNSHGGVNDRQLKIDQCFTDGTTTASLNCANTIVQDKAIGVLGGEDLGIDATIPVYNSAKLATIAMPVLGTASLTNPSLFGFTSAGTATDEGAMITMKAQGVTNVGYVAPDLPTFQSHFTDVIQPLAADLGLTANLVSYSLTSPDYTTAVQTAQAAGDTGLVDLSTEAGCLALGTAVSQLAFKGPVVYTDCIQFVSTLGAAAAGASVFSFLWLPQDISAAPASEQAEIKIYTSAMSKAGHASEIDNATAAQGFALVMNAASVLGTIKGTPTKAALFQKLRSLKNFPSFMGQPVTCDPRPVLGQAACGKSLLVYRVTSAGKFKLQGNGFLFLPALPS